LLTNRTLSSQPDKNESDYDDFRQSQAGDAIRGWVRRSTSKARSAQAHQVVSTGNPAVAEEAWEIVLTGLTEGSVVPPQVAFGGRMAEILFFGKAPGFPGLN